MKRLSWKYIAGLIDGEGTLDVQVTKGIYVRPRVRINMTTHTAGFLLEWLHANFGGYLYLREYKQENWNQSTSWELVGYGQACTFLRNVVNHLYIKQEQARFLLYLERSVKGKPVGQDVRELIRNELKAMKHDPHRLSEVAEAQIDALLKR